MIAASRAVAIGAFATALALHLGGSLGFDFDENVLIEGDAVASEAALGNSFADMSEGVLSGVETTEMTEPPDPIEDRTEVEQPDQETLQAPAPETATTSIQPVDVAPVPPELAVVPRVEVTETPRQSQTLAVLPQVAPEAVQPVQPPTETLSSDAPENAEVTQSARPNMRSRAFEEEHAPKVQQRQAAEQPRRIQEAPRRGTGATQETRRGIAAGTQTGTRSTASEGRTARGQDGGNAAVSNYPGIVTRCVNRARNVRGMGRGQASVAFRVTGRGGISSISVVRSSGSAAFDRAAAQAIARSGPCPAPPPGAQTSFSIRVVGR